MGLPWEVPILGKCYQNQREFLKPLKETGKDTGKVNIEMVIKNLFYFMFTHEM